MEKKYTAYVAVGHGTQTSGVWDGGCTYGNYTEADLMLPIAKYTVSALRTSGVTVLTDADSNNNKNMTYTVRDANNAGVDVYVSLHCDWEKAPTGTYPIVHPNSANGRKLANSLNNVVMSAMGLTTRGVLAREDYEVTYTDAPACIFETGSIRADINTLLKSKQYGEAVAKGICDYLGVKYKGSTTTQSTTNTVNKPAQDKVVTTQSTKIAVDGEWGKNTTKATQTILKSGYIDGVVSGQLISCQEYLEACLESSWEFDNGDGSPMVEKLQKLVGAKVDGYAGKETVTKMQKFLNKKGFNCGKVDGYCGEKTVKAWQKYLNSKLK